MIPLGLTCARSPSIELQDLTPFLWTKLLPGRWARDVNNLPDASVICYCETLSKLPMKHSWLAFRLKFTTFHSYVTRDLTSYVPCFELWNGWKTTIRLVSIEDILSYRTRLHPWCAPFVCSAHGFNSEGSFGVRFPTRADWIRAWSSRIVTGLRTCLSASERPTKESSNLKYTTLNLLTKSRHRCSWSAQILKTVVSQSPYS